ncbi:hypothetical protein B566_EDAN009078 [Ephemera danica]|nr:hypothetical protein B566_EDAN009078 [Ephemera danica]
MKVIIALFVLVTVASAHKSEDGHQEEYNHHPKYNFAYAVKDTHTHDIKHHNEHRDGDKTEGEYSLVEPDGTIRTVKYHVHGKSGFVATVHRSGHSVHPQPVHHYQPEKHTMNSQSEMHTMQKTNIYSQAQPEKHTMIHAQPQKHAEYPQIEKYAMYSQSEMHAQSEKQSMQKQAEHSQIEKYAMYPQSENRAMHSQSEQNAPEKHVYTAPMHHMAPVHYTQHAAPIYHHAPQHLGVAAQYHQSIHRHY